MKFKKKCVIITGAAVGIGKAAVTEFLKQGAFVAAIDVNTEKLAKLKTVN